MSFIFDNDKEICLKNLNTISRRFSECRGNAEMKHTLAYQGKLKGIYANYGLKYTLIKGLYQFTRIPLFKLSPPMWKDPVVDLVMGDEVNIRIKKETLDVCHHSSGNENHVPVDSFIFKRAVQATGLRYEDYSFIDIGSGLGKACLLASNFNFKAIYGVELSPSLFSRSCKNLHRFKSISSKGDNIFLSNLNALDFEFPEGNPFIHIYRPFNEQVMREFKQKLIASENMKSHNITMVSIFPYDREFMETFDGFTMSKEVFADNFKFCWQLLSN